MSGSGGVLLLLFLYKNTMVVRMKRPLNWWICLLFYCGGNLLLLMNSKHCFWILTECFIIFAIACCWHTSSINREYNPFPFAGRLAVFVWKPHVIGVFVASQHLPFKIEALRYLFQQTVWWLTHHIYLVFTVYCNNIPFCC